MPCCLTCSAFTAYSLMLVQSSGQSCLSLAVLRALISVRTISLNTFCQRNHCAAFTVPAVRIRVFSLYRGPVTLLRVCHGLGRRSLPARCCMWLVRGA